MGASGSTRRIIVEEDEKQGAFLVQVSDSVTKQIYGIKESGGKAAKKPVDPIQKAVEAAPAVKPALPIQAFPAIPLGSPTPPLTPPPSKAAVAAAGSEATAKAEEKPTPADAAAAAETEDKKPEDHVAPEAAAQEEKKPVEEMSPTSPPEGSAAAESSFDQGPVPPPKIPRSALLQLLSPSPSPALPTESKIAATESQAAASPYEPPLEKFSAPTPEPSVPPFEPTVETPEFKAETPSPISGVIDSKVMPTPSEAEPVVGIEPAVPFTESLPSAFETPSAPLTAQVAVSASEMTTLTPEPASGVTASASEATPLAPIVSVTAPEAFKGTAPAVPGPVTSEPAQIQAKSDPSYFVVFANPDNTLTLDLTDNLVFPAWMTESSSNVAEATVLDAPSADFVFIPSESSTGSTETVDIPAESGDAAATAEQSGPSLPESDKAETAQVEIQTPKDGKPVKFPLFPDVASHVSETAESLANQSNNIKASFAAEVSSKVAPTLSKEVIATTTVVTGETESVEMVLNEAVLTSETAPVVPSETPVVEVTHTYETKPVQLDDAGQSLSETVPDPQPAVQTVTSQDPSESSGIFPSLDTALSHIMPNRASAAAEVVSEVVLGRISAEPSVEEASPAEAAPVVEIPTIPAVTEVSVTEPADTLTGVATDASTAREAAPLPASATEITYTTAPGIVVTPETKSIDENIVALDAVSSENVAVKPRDTVPVEPTTPAEGDLIEAATTLDETSVSTEAVMTTNAEVPIERVPAEIAPVMVEKALTEVTLALADVIIPKVAPVPVEAAVTQVTPAADDVTMPEVAIPEAVPVLAETALAPGGAAVAQVTSDLVEAAVIEVAPAPVEAVEAEVAPALVEAVEAEVAPAPVEAFEAEVAPAPFEAEVAPAPVEAAEAEVAPAQVEAAEAEVAPAQVEAAVAKAVPAAVEAAVTEVSPAEISPALVDAAVIEVAHAPVELAVAKPASAAVKATVTEVALAEAAPTPVEAAVAEAAPAPVKASEVSTTLVVSADAIMSEVTLPEVVPALAESPPTTSDVTLPKAAMPETAPAPAEVSVTEAVPAETQVTEVAPFLSEETVTEEAPAMAETTETEAVPAPTEAASASFEEAPSPFQEAVTQEAPAVAEATPVPSRSTVSEAVLVEVAMPEVTPTPVEDTPALIDITSAPADTETTLLEASPVSTEISSAEVAPTDEIATCKVTTALSDDITAPTRDEITTEPVSVEVSAPAPTEVAKSIPEESAPPKPSLAQEKPISLLPLLDEVMLSSSVDYPGTDFTSPIDPPQQVSPPEEGTLRSIMIAPAILSPRSASAQTPASVDTQVENLTSPKCEATTAEGQGPTEKESPPEKKAPALATPDKALYEEREMLYKQMGEVYRERDKALKAIEDFYREKMNALQNQSTKMHSATRQEFNKAVEEVEKKFLKHVEAPVCEDLQLKVLECYRTNKTYPLNCSAEVQAFSSAVDQARQNVILAKKG